MYKTNIIRARPCMLAAILFMLVSTALAANVQAKKDSGTLTVNEDYYYSYPIELANSGELSYNIRVVTGPHVDVYLMDKKNFDSYQTDSSTYFMIKGSMEDTSLATVDKISLDSGQYYLVIDNTDFGKASPPANFMEDPATVAYTIEYNEVSTDAGAALLGFAVIFIIIAMVVVVIVLLIRRRRAPAIQAQFAAPPPQQPMPPPQAPPYQPPPQQPMPPPPQAPPYQPPPQQPMPAPPQAPPYQPPPQQYMPPPTLPGQAPQPYVPPPPVEKPPPPPQ